MDLKMWLFEQLITLVSTVIVAIAILLKGPKILQWFERRGQTSHQKTRKRLKEEYDDVLYYALHTDMMIGKMINAAMFMLLYIFALVLLSLITPIMFNVITIAPHLSIPQTASTFILVISCVCLVSALSATTVAVAKFAFDSFNLYHHVKFLPIYAQSIPDDIRNQTMEKLVEALIVDKAAQLSSGAIEKLTQELEELNKTKASEKPKA